MAPSCPNWLRIVLLCLTTASFLPQLHRIRIQKTSTGLSLLYILLNLLGATEQFTLAFFLTVNAGPEPDFFVHFPRSIGDWLNLAQLGVVWVMFLLLFILSLVYPAPYHPFSYRIIAATLYTAFALISIVPLFIDALFPTVFRDPDDRSLGFGVGLFAGGHFFIISLLVTLLSICSIIAQATRLRSQLSSPSPGLGVVSFRDWALQGVVFAVLAVSWIFRARIGSEEDVTWPFRSIFGYLRMGWAAGGSGIFAMVQAGLVVLGRGWSHEGVVLGESEPLLGEQRDEDVSGVNVCG
ncbi:hypothetical protein BO78DRAFT_429336 [Aspergillus sclerotiicarbonarius CBS 121057]|uniref:Uncharacterized protein n=1 Tax=Aspergillus sclerotiicarbonarius (strain CBS 121057 / IBT 28362) TaxID=1448318 RepID=A0A319ESN6_ASPSB|nr:hypothetical protein BO78DRAFT_429336 [Aspergillus sclerotiicarbonarius CBS 121057]